MLVINPESSCDICLEHFSVDGDQRAPHAPRCGHVFCLRCLKSLTRRVCPMCRTPFQRSEVTKIHLEQQARSSDSSTKLARELHNRINSFVQTGASTSVAHSLAEDCKKFFQENSSTDHHDSYVTYQLLKRRSRAHMRDRMTSRSSTGDAELGDENERRRSRARQNPQGNATDDDLREAIEESRRTAEDRDLQEALRLSREEEEKRKAAQNSIESAPFDNNNRLPVPNNGFPLFDASSQPQFTGIQPQFTAVQPQFTAFNPWQQQAEQQAMQAQWAQQQNEWLRQQQELQAQQELRAQQQAQFQLAQQQEEWLRQQNQQQQHRQLLLQQQQQQQQQQQMFLQPQGNPLIAQPTGFGSNNPFAPTQPASSPSPTSFSPPPQNLIPTFNLPGTFKNRYSTALTTGTNPFSKPQQPQNPKQPFFSI